MISDKKHFQEIHDLNERHALQLQELHWHIQRHKGNRAAAERRANEAAVQLASARAENNALIRDLNTERAKTSDLAARLEKSEKARVNAEKTAAALVEKHQALALAGGSVAQAKKVHAWMTEPEPEPEPEMVEVTVMGQKLTVTKEEYDKWARSTYRNRDMMRDILNTRSPFIPPYVNLS